MMDESTMDAGMTQMKGNQSALRCDDGEIFALKQTPELLMQQRKTVREARATDYLPLKGLEIIPHESDSGSKLLISAATSAAHTPQKGSQFEEKKRLSNIGKGIQHQETV